VVSYARIVAVSYGLLTVMGLIPGLNTTFGLVPIYGADVALHGVIAAVSAYFGFAVRASDPVRS
jgi:acyl-CoA synthetase (NDP forming)